MNVIELTQQLVGFETINPPGYEVEICHFLERLFQQAGFSTTVSSFGENRNNLIATIGGGQQKPPIAFTGHMDTVPLGTEQWSYDPFAGTIDNNRIYGRGTCDMKGGIAAAMCAAFELADKAADGPGVTFIITGGEETGAEGAKHYAEQKPVDQAIGALVVAEPTNLIPLAGHKGAFWLKATCKGKAAHGSMPERGDNAIYKMATAAKKLQAFEFLDDRHKSLGKPSLNIGTASGGQNTNSVADHAEMTIDIRTLPCQRHDQLLRDLQAHLGDDVELEPFVDLPGVWSGENETWFDALEQLVAQTTGQRHGIQSAPYFTDASVLTPSFGHIPTVILGPGDPQDAHTVDESCSLRQLEQAVAIYKSLILDWQQ